jgi:hypothetical protein
MDALLISVTWLLAFVSGGWFAVGTYSALSGHALVNPRRIEWTRAEVALLGAMQAGQGLILAVYALVGGLALGAHVIPIFWAGHWWGILVSAPAFLLVYALVFLQFWLEKRHLGHWPFSDVRNRLG